LSVLIKLVKSGNTKYFLRILRALFAFESHQITRRMIKDMEHPDDSAKEKLIRLLGLDNEKYELELRESFAEFKFEKTKFCTD